MEYYHLSGAYCFSKETQVQGSEKSRISVRLQELVAIHGKHWGAIAEIMEKEGIREKGNPLSSNALRKRYKKLSETDLRSEMEKPVSTQEQEGSDFDRLQKNRMDFALKQFGRGGSAPAGSVEDAIAGLVTLNTQSLAQIKESNSLMQRLEKRLEEQESKTSHTEHTDEQSVTTRDLLELLKEMSTGRAQQMQHIEEEKGDIVSKEDVQHLIDEIVEERVEAELKSMLTPEGSFASELSNLVDQRLKTLFSGGEPVEKAVHSGPGRGKKGKTHKKFSASLEESLFERAKSLPGQFSGHLSNALEAYLAVMEEKKPE
jgi:hypothetical protein